MKLRANANKVLALLLTLALVAGLGLCEEAPARTLPEGKYIVGKDIEPGLYTLTCVDTAGEQLSNAYGALGGALDALDGQSGGKGGYGALFGALGGVFKQVAGLTVEILGDYGDVLKRYTLKPGDSLTLRLEAETALSLSDGSCAIAPADGGD